MMQFAHDQFDHDDIIEVTDDRNVVRQDVLGVGKINKCGEHSLTRICRQFPFFVLQHTNHGFELWNAFGDKVGQGRFGFYVRQHIDNGLDDLCFLSIAHGVTRFLERFAEELKIPITQFE